MRNGRIPPLTPADPTPFEPTEANIDTSKLPKYPKDAKEYWLIVDTIWPAIRDIFVRVGLSADIPRIEEMKQKRDAEIIHAFDKAWIAAPDAYYIHTWPQWGRFCDLCSEYDVLFEDKNT